MKKTILLLFLSLSVAVVNVEAQSFLKKLEKSIKKGADVITDVEKVVNNNATTQSQNPTSPSNSNSSTTQNTTQNAPQNKQVNVQGIVPKITAQTKFVYVKPYSRIDRLVRDSMVMIVENYELSYVNLNGEYIYGTNSKMKKGGAGYNNTRGFFSDGVAMVARDNIKNSIIYTNQKYLDIPATYEKVTGFTEGIAMAEKRSGTKYASCYINNQGKEVLPGLSIVYSYYTDNFEVGEQSEELRAYLDPEKKRWGYADTNGKIVIPAQFHKTLPFSDGLAAVLVGEQSYSAKWGFVNKKGVLQIPAKYKYYPSSFSDGLAAVRTGDDSGSKMAFIDKTGAIVSPEYYACNNFKDGYAFIKDKFDHTAVIDTKFNVVKVFGEKEWFEIPHDDANNIYGLKFEQSLTAVKLFHGGRVILNPKGDVIYNNINEELDNFSDGTHAYATVKVGTNICSGFINKAGEFVIVFIPEELRLTINKSEEKLGSPDPVVFVPISKQPIITPIAPQPAPPKQGIGRLSRRKTTAPEARKYALTLEVHPQEAGIAEGRGIHVEGSVITLNTKMTNENKYKYTFVRWEKYNGEKLSASPSFNYQMPSSVMHLNAVYKTNSRYKLFIVPTNSDIISVKGGGDYYLDEPFEIEATLLKNGYKFKGWYLDDMLYSKSAVLTKPMPAENLRLMARYQEDEFSKWFPSVLLSSNIPDVQMNGAGQYNVDDEFTISVNVPQGYQFVGWYGHRRNLITSQSVYKRKIGNRSLHYRAIFQAVGSSQSPQQSQQPPQQKPGGESKPENIQEIIKQVIAISGVVAKSQNSTTSTQNAPTEKIAPKSWSFAGSFDLNLSSQSIVGFPNTLPGLKLPTTAYFELHNGYNMPTPYAGDVLGAIYFDFDTVAMSPAIKQKIKDVIVEKFKKQSGYTDDPPRIEKEYKSWGIEMDGVMNLFPMPLLIYKITNTHIYGYGNLTLGANRSLSSSSLIPNIMRFEYSFSPDLSAIILGKYEVYEHDITRENGHAQNKYQWMNHGVENRQHSVMGYKKGEYSEPEMENRFKGCELYLIRNKMSVPFYPKPNMARALDKGMRDTAENDKRWGAPIKGMTFADFLQRVYAEFFEEIYNEQRLYDQPNIITDTPLPKKN